MWTIRCFILFSWFVISLSQDGRSQIIAIRPTALTDPHIAPLIVSNYSVDSLDLIHKYVRRWNRFEYDKRDVSWVTLSDKSMIEFYQSLLSLACIPSDEGMPSHQEHGIEICFIGYIDEQIKKIFIKEKAEAMSQIDYLIELMSSARFVGHDQVVTELMAFRLRFASG